MAIREEYQQLEAEIKKEEDRRRKLDLISAGVITPDDSYIYFETYAYKEKGLYADDQLKEIHFELDKIFEIIESRDKYLNLSDLSLLDDELINASASINFEDRIPRSLKFFIAILDQLYSIKLQSRSRKKENLELLKRIGDTKTRCEELLLLYEEAITNKTTISIDDIHKYKSQLFYKQFNDNNLDDEIKRLEAKQGRKLSPKESNDYSETYRNRLVYENIVRPFAALIIYLLLIDDKATYRPIVVKYMKESFLESSDNNATIKSKGSNHTIDDVFKLLTKYPKTIITNILGYFKECGVIDLLEFSRIIDAINSFDLKAFVSALNNRFATILDTYYDFIKIGYTIVLYVQSQSEQESVITVAQIIRIYKNNSIRIPQAEMLDSLVSDDTDISKESAKQLLESFSGHIWQLLGVITHYYYKYKHILLQNDQECFDRLFTHEPYKYLCEKALLDYNKQFNKLDLNIFGLASTLYEQAHDETKNAQSIAEENNNAEDIANPMEREDKMIDNPFDGLNPDAKKACVGDKKNYVGLFIDYLIDRGYIDSENKDAFVRCLCDDEIPESTLDNLKYNVTNKEGRGYKNIVTIMIGRLTRFTADNQIVVDGRVISKGSIFFNIGQINNGELEEWCLFWPFLKDKIKTGKGSLFQSQNRSNVSVIENALKRVNSFINDYEAAKRQDPSITKLDFIKKRH